MKYSVILLLFFSRIIFAQGEAAVPFLQIQPSPNLNGMAGAFTSLPSNDPFGHYFNPAQLGSFSKSSKIAYGFYPSKTKWLPVFNFSDLTFSSSAFSLGINMSEIFPSIPFSLGFGYIDTELDLGENIWTTETGEYISSFHSYENYDAYAIGVGIKYYIQFNIGYSFKSFKSYLSPPEIDNVEYTPAKGDATDFGIQVNIPFIKLYNEVFLKSVSTTDSFMPYFDISLGYAVMNAGDPIKYNDMMQSDPLPKTAKIGYGVSFGIIIPFSKSKISLVKFDWGTEARDVLVKRENGIGKYINSPGKINLIDNVFLGKSNDQIYIYQGWRVKFLETFQFSYGRFKGPGYYDFQRTFSYMFSTSGLFKWLSENNTNEVFTLLYSRLELNYALARYNSFDPLNMTEFEGINIIIKNINL